MKNFPANADMVIRRRTKRRTLATASNAPTKPNPPIHLCRLCGGVYEYLTGFEGDRVVIRECLEVEAKKDGPLTFAWERGRTICSEAKERLEEVFALCALLNFFKDEIQFFNEGWDGDNETVNKALSKLVAERRCRPSNLLIQIEPGQEFYTGKENHVSETGKHLQFVKLFRDYANNGAGKEAADHDAK